MMTALYYPWIDVRDDHWLRTACLFWETIRTIVPESLAQPYSSDLGQALASNAVLVPLRVASDMAEIEALTDEVLDYLTNPTASGVLFGDPDAPASYIHPEKLPRDLRDFVGLHPEKLSHELRHYLHHYLRESFTHEGWYRVDERFANYYMTILATRLAHRVGAGLTTSWGAADALALAAMQGNAPLAFIEHSRWRRHPLGGPLGPRRHVPTELVPSMLLELVVEGLSISPDTTPTKLLRFREKHADELSAFRAEIDRLLSDIPSGTPLEACKQAVRDRYEHHVQPAVRNLKQSLRSSRIKEATAGFLKVSLLSAGPTSLAVQTGLPVTTALLAAMGVSMMASLVQIRVDRERAIAASPYSYLMSLDRMWGAV